MRRLLALIAAGLVAAPSLPASAADQVLFRLTDHRLDEVSGIARGIVSPGSFYVQNDSGDSARFFALDARTGAVQAEYHVPDATNVDWEDLAVAPSPRGVPSVWLGDIGDNRAVRDQVQLYRVREPQVRVSARPVSTGEAQIWHLRYPHGAANAESLAVAPGGDAYIVTKVPDGRSAVYAVPPHPSDAVQTLRRIGTLRLAADADSIVPANYQRLATGAAISRDGRLFVVRTYTTAYVWQVRGGDIAAALRGTPRRIDLPLQPQEEGVCIDGDRLVLSSEQVGAPVFSVPLPDADEESTPSPTAGATTREQPSASAHASAHDTSAVPVRLIVVAGAVVVVGVAVVVLRRRRRGAHDPPEPPDGR